MPHHHKQHCRSRRCHWGWDFTQQSCSLQSGFIVRVAQEATLQGFDQDRVHKCPEEETTCSCVASLRTCSREAEWDAYTACTTPSRWRCWGGSCLSRATLDLWSSSTWGRPASRWKARQSRKPTNNTQVGVQVTQQQQFKILKTILLCYGYFDN